MRPSVLSVHTYYQQSGGEDTVFASEVALLRERGHDVMTYTLHNGVLAAMPKIQAALCVHWNTGAYRELRQKIRAFRPQVVHVHNTFPLASPAVVRAAKAEGIPVVVTLHNYRLFCLNALFYREGRPCEDCLGHLPWRGVIRGCYRSKGESMVVASILTLHRVLDTWGLVDQFITPSEFSRRKCIEGGLPENKIVVKPNFVHPDPGMGDGGGGYALFVGRLTPEKGVRTLLRAWELLGGRVNLWIVGDGPLAPEVREAARSLPGVRWLGRKTLEEVYALMGSALFLVLPSECYETFGRVAIEAFAKGTPVVAANIGAVGEVTRDGSTGLNFRPGDPEDLAATVERLLSHPEELCRMRKEARAEYEAQYTAERNYQMLMEIYERAIKVARGG